MTDWLGDGISMFPNAAVCAIATGAALLLSNAAAARARSAATWLAAATIAIAALTLFEHATGTSLGLDALLFQKSWGQAAADAPMRMGLPASLAFFLAGCAVALRPRAAASSVSSACAVGVLAIAALPLVGRLYGAQQMYSVPGITGIATLTASTLLAVAIGLITSAPDREPMRTVLDPNAGGILVRRALPLVIVGAILVGLLRISLESAGLVTPVLGTALRTLIEIALVTVLLWWAAAIVRVHDRALRQTDVEMRRQAHQLAAFIETAAIGLRRLGEDGTILWANDAELQILGYAPGEYVGHNIVEFYLDPRVAADFLDRLRRGERLFEYPAQLRCKDGSSKAVLIDSSVLRDPDGLFVHTQCFTRDVSAQRAAEETRALLASIVQTSDDAIVSKTLDGRITTWNAGAERIFGYTEAEAVGRPIELIIPLDRLDEEREILRKLRQGERIEHFETVRRTKDGRLIDISLSISPLRDSSGTIKGASKIARDISDRHRAEAEREENTRRKDEFLAILAHELRNPLAPVRTSARYLRLKDLADADAKRSVEMIERQVAQMSRLIDDLLDVSRISRGMLELRRERIPCASIVEAAIDVCREQIEGKHHRLRVVIPEEPIELDADRERLIQVLCNLLGNAVKYTPIGGQIGVRVRRDSASTIEIAVRDDGAGIPAGKEREIFDLFVRMHPSLEDQGGLGIGLTLVRQLVELHGGTIEAQSAGVGRGSEFVVKLPVVVAPRSTSSWSASAPSTIDPLRIVVADDNRDAVESLVLLLEMSGHDVHGVFDGDAAFRAIERLRPRVALLDIGMPKADGYQVARRVREQPWGAAIHLVALTGWGQDADRRKAQEAGFDAHLVKPVAPETLDRLLAAIDPVGPVAEPSKKNRLTVVEPVR